MPYLSLQASLCASPPLDFRPHCALPPRLNPFSPRENSEVFPC